MLLIKPQSSYEAKKEDLWSVLCAEIDALPSLAACEDWWVTFQLLHLRKLPVAFQSPIRDRLADRKSELVAMSQSRFLDAQWRRAMERDQ